MVCTMDMWTTVVVTCLSNFEKSVLDGIDCAIIKI